MTAKQVAGLAERRIRQIQALPEHPRRAALANLRRGVGRAPGELPELWGSFLQEMPPEFFTQSGSATAAEWAVYLARTGRRKTPRRAAPFNASARWLRPTA